MTKTIRPKNKPVMVEDEAALYLDADEVDISDIKERAVSEGYREQTERHVTIIGDSAGKAIKEALLKHPLEQKQQFLNIVKKLLLELDWEFKFKEIYHIEKTGTFYGGGEHVEERQSYIRAINMPAMEEFYRELNKLLDLNLPTQFPHITLFTKGERENPVWYGIGIGSEEKFKTLSPIKV